MPSSRDGFPAVEPVVTEVLPAHPLDRRRIDSDVREMLRQPSTPWITFNRASRASGLAAGDVLPRRASVLEVLAPVAPAAPTTEPSTMAVASDVGTEMPSVITTTPVVSEATVPTTLRRSGWSPLSIAVIAAGLTLSAGLVVATSTYDAPARQVATPAAPTKAAAKAEAPPSEAPLTDLGAGLGSASIGHGSATEPAKDPKAPAAKDAKDTKFGRLTIRGAAKGKNVFLDGKRLLGTGVRSFTVQCGTHVVSTQGREGGSAVEVPCNGELVVDR